MGHLSERDYDDRWDEREPDDYFDDGCVHGAERSECRVCTNDSLTDPLDDGTRSLAPAQFDPLCELRGEPWPADSVQAASFEYEIAHW